MLRPWVGLLSTAREGLRLYRGKLADAERRSRICPIAEIVQRARADGEREASWRAVDHPVHRYPNSTAARPVGRDQPPNPLRDWVTGKTLHMPDQRLAEDDFRTHQLAIIGRCPVDIGVCSQESAFLGRACGSATTAQSMRASDSATYRYRGPVD